MTIRLPCRIVLMVIGTTTRTLPLGNTSLELTEIKNLAQRILNGADDPYNITFHCPSRMLAQSENTLKELIALGDLSKINETVERCVAYHCNRREQYRLPRTFASVEDYQYCGMEQMSANYLYIFDDGAWHVCGLDRTSEWIGLDWK